jgi:cytochrome P450
MAINLIGNGLVALLTNPDQLTLLHENPHLMPGTVQELLRYCGPAIVAMIRYATEDITIGQTLIHQGDRVQPVLSSANHDPTRHPNPEQLDITRNLTAAGIPHLAYSHGAHYCVGATLADHEAQIAFTTLLNRYPHLTLAVPQHKLEWKQQPLTRELLRLPIKLGN